MYLALLLELSLAQSNRMGQSVSWSQKSKRHLCHADTEVDPQKTPSLLCPHFCLLLHALTKVTVEQPQCECWTSTELSLASRSLPSVFLVVVKCSSVSLHALAQLQDECYVLQFFIEDFM